MSVEKDKSDFTPRELEIMGKAWNCMTEEPKASIATRLHLLQDMHATTHQLEQYAAVNPHVLACAAGWCQN